jgi:hypothetical protein
MEMAITTGYSSIHSTVRIVADVWKEFIANAPKPSGLVQVMNFGLLVLIAVQIGLFFF